MPPVLQRNAGVVTADGLPTVQIDGVVWSQVVVGTTVYAGGKFTNARPAGAAAGTNLTSRPNLLAYDITTGNLVTSFAPSLNAQVKVVARSPDGSRIYVGGSFTQANGATRNKIAAYSTSTGALVASFAPNINNDVFAISVTNTAVYVGGIFTAANGVTRAHLAAFDPNSGALLSWAPSTDNVVQAMVMTPDSSRVIVGGQFAAVNSSTAKGVAALDASTAALLPFATNTAFSDSGANSGVLNLSTDGTSIFGSTWSGGTGNFEGVFSATPQGTLNWMEDCHGDSYGVFSSGAAAYVVSHEHYCLNVGGFPDTNPRSAWYRSTAFSVDAQGTVQHNQETGNSYGDFAGKPSPAMINWYPALDVGSFTGTGQAAWSVTGNSQYVVEGGEFPRVNGAAQQGLVRFAVPSLAPNHQGPQLSGSAVTTTLTARSSTSIQVSWLTNYDRDDENLTYTITRNGAAVYKATAVSQFWNHPMLSFLDTGLAPGTTYTYRVQTSDPDGNSALGSNYTIATPSGSSTPYGQYASDVFHQGADGLLAA